MPLTASNTELLPHCLYYARADVAAGEAGEDRTLPSGRFGNACHAISARYVDARIFDEMEIRAFMAREGVPPEEYARVVRVSDGAVRYVDDLRARLPPDVVVWSEVALAWNVLDDTTRILPAKYHRDYRDAAPGEICGTVDLMWRVGRKVYVVDWKTGDPTTHDEQMKTLGVMAFGLYPGEVDEVEVIIVHLEEAATTEHPRYFDEMEIAAVAADLQDRHARIAESEPTPGPHCANLYCGVIANCPATHATMDELTPERVHLPIVGNLAGIMGDGHAAQMYERLRAIDRASKQAWGALKAYMEEHGAIPLPGHKVWTTITYLESRLDGKAALELAASKGATPAEIEACKRTKSVTRPQEKSDDR